MKSAVAAVTMSIAVTAAAVTAVCPEPPGGSRSMPVALTTLVVEGSSTNPGGDGIADFYGGRFADPDTTTVNFLTGPYGIWSALRSSDSGPDTVLSSGWGAANASLLLGYLGATGDPMLTGSTWVLDNNVAGPNGGFGTRYPVFAAIGVNPLPTALPDTAAGDVVVISTATEYDLNSNAPKYLLNPVADLNSLATYLDGRLGQGSLVLPVNDDGTPGCAGAAGCTATTTPGGPTEVSFTTADGQPGSARVEQVDGVTYVGYRTERLPLLAPLRRYGGATGTLLADAAEPALRATVDYGYPNNDPLADPGNHQPAGLLPTPTETRTYLRNLRAGLATGGQLLRNGVADRTGADRPAADTAGAQTQPGADGRRSVRGTADSVRPPAVRAAVQRLSRSLGIGQRDAAKPDARQHTDGQ